MHNINIEFSKGILFVRLFGSINKKNSIETENKILNVLNKSGIKYLVFNINELKIEEDVDIFEKCEKKIKENNGKMIVCGKTKMNFKMASDELKAMRAILSC